ncbi:MAG: YlbF family regulator [Eubacteriales bacterium]|nr:YlbF family regulator [Clostridia bacterium]MDY2845505.1 YlbF family regulator [Eubacteriales bacterium]
MEEKLTPEMKEVIAKLGELVKADERCTRIQSTISDYEHSEELTALIGEYNTQQNLLADAYNKPEGDQTASEEFKSAVQARIDALYDQITTHPVYTAYVAAKNEFDALTQEIYAELQFVITGERPCSHDCSSCGGSCGCH